jgi:hypothetical protein
MTSLPEVDSTVAIAIVQCQRNMLDLRYQKEAMLTAQENSMSHIMSQCVSMMAP